MIMPSRLSLALAVLGTILWAPVRAQRATGENQQVTQRPRPAAPQRQIAPTMSYLYADWLTRAEREREEQPDRVVKALQIPRGSTVVDLGAGVGYFTWRLAKRVGPEGKVIAVDIQQGMLNMLDLNLKKRGIENVEIVLGTQEDPRLPEDEVDLALLVDVYHELAFPARTMEHVRRSLKPGGRLVVVEYRKEDPWIPIHPLHKMTVGQVQQEIEPVGFEFLEVLNFLPNQHIVVFTPKKP